MSDQQRRLRGHAWFVRRFGLRTWWQYRQALREGVTIDYARIFTPDELADLEERGLALWKRRGSL